MSEIKFVYSITPDPYPILVSNTIDLNVTITNPNTYSVPIDHITIVIPTGEDVGADLSQADLPSPTYTNPNWNLKIEQDGSTIIITPKTGTTGLDGGATLVFSLDGIVVNATPGNVQIAIQEFYPEAVSPPPHHSDVDTTQELTKRAANFPVTRFWVEPPVLYNLDQPVTLKWTCGEQEKAYTYSVHPVGELPTDCENDVNKCKSCADGKFGVTFQNVNQTTTYALYVLEPTPDGHRAVVDEYTLNTTVKVETPYFTPNSSQTLYFHGYCMLRWLAFNAVENTCKVMLDAQTVITDKAPVDTYERGYLIPLLNYNPGTMSHQLAVTAYGHTDDEQETRGCLSFLKPAKAGAMMAQPASGPATATFPFPNFVVNPSPAFVTGISAPGNMDISLDVNNPLAFVQNYDNNNVTVIDVVNHSVKATIAVGSGNDRHSGIGVTPDNKFVLVTNSASNNVSLIDIPTLKVTGNPISTCTNPTDVIPTFAADKQTVLALVMGGDGKTVTLLNITTSSKVTDVTLDYAIDGITTTPDGKYALVGHRQDNCMTVIDITNPSAPAKTVVKNVPSPGSFTIAFHKTTGINYALVVDSGNASKSITVVDVNNKKVIGPVTVGPGPSDVVATPDGTLALVANFGGGSGNTVSVLDVSDPLKPQITQTITVGTGVVSNVLTYDGALAIVAFKDATSTVTLIDVANLTTTNFNVGSAYRFVGRPIISPNDRFALVADRDNNRVLVL